jgi:ParB family chromosome partitioning protein
MAKKKTTAKKKAGAARKRAGAARKRAGSARKRLTPRKQKQGLEASDTTLDLAAPEVRALVNAVQAVGGAPVGAYREPLRGRPLLLAEVPIEAVDPTPFQRDLSPTHTRRLAEKIEETGAFLDPLTVVQGRDGRLWTPNGRHRLAAAKLLGLRCISALISPDEELAFKILALNTEKAHNLKDRSLEVIRMARELARRKKTARESDYAAEFESAALLTLGIVYEQEGRFAGGAYHPFLRRVDRFSSGSLGKSLQQREGWAARLLEIDAEVKGIVEALRQRGFRSPYLRTLVVARINPVRFMRPKRAETKPPMAIGPALTRMAAAARRFDVGAIRERDLALVAAVAADDEAA